jgi:hypothetical protein
MLSVPRLLPTNARMRGRALVGLGIIILDLLLHYFFAT